MLAGALVGRKEEWHTFAQRWKKALKKSPTVSHFHGKECSSLNGAFAQFRDEAIWPKPTGRNAANAKRDLLRALIEESPVVAIGVGVLVPDYERIKASHKLGPTHMSADVFEWALQNTLIQCSMAIRRIDPDATIRFISDNSNKASRYEEVFANFRTKNPQNAPSMVSLSHQDEEKCPGLQAADMISTVVKGVYDDQFNKGQIDESRPLLSEFYRICMVDESYLLAVLDGQSANKPQTDTNVSAKGATT